LFSSVKLSEPNNKVSIEITVYGIIRSLGADLFRANIISDPSCACGFPLEDAIHYLLECANKW
jgi:hypothetical protein